MKQEKTNSRRHFLSTMAMLGSATVLAGSPLPLFDTKTPAASLKKSWSLLQKNYGASVFLNLTGGVPAFSLPFVPGQVNKEGKMVEFREENLLAQPTWIYWGKNTSEPDDVVITFYGNVYPYKKIKSINRFEMQALAQLPNNNNLLHAICTQPTEEKSRLAVHTRIAKSKITQDVHLVANNNIVLKQQFFYNV
jgi:hypothetical protein